jgi:hypothetical protein
MPSILDNLRNSAQAKGLFGQASGATAPGAATPFGPSAAGPTAPGAATDQTTALGQLAAAKSGKAAPAAAPAAPAASSVQEQVANRVAAAASEQAAGQNAVAQQALTQEAAGEAAQVSAANKQVDAKLLDVRTDMTNRATAIIADYTQNRAKLEMQGAQARAEQLGFLLRLSNERYVQQLQDAGRRARLENQAAFQDSLMRTTFDEELGLYNQDLQFRSMLRSDDAEFQKQLAGVDISFALEMAKQQATQANQTQLFTGIGGLTQAGVSAYGANEQSKHSDYQSAVSSGYRGSYSQWQAQNAREDEAGGPVQ